MKKKYRFDYIEEWVSQWRPEIPRTVERIEMTPYAILLPIITLDENCNLVIKPAKDYYGEDIDNLEEWSRQRHEYCIELAKRNTH